ncbi:MAG: IPT/TIG domain-containing protein [Blastocatellia bacterium]
MTVYGQGGATRYVYDDNGRLRAVIAPNGEANVYEYDPAGNITAIRLNAATTLEVLSFSPREGVPGAQVTIIGTGFGAGVNAVAFNGVSAQIVSSAAPVITVTVPAGASTGPISVTTPGGTAMTAAPFTVRGIQVTPAAETILTAQALEFSAAVVGTGDPSVIWSVDGIEGGSAQSGTISTVRIRPPAGVIPVSPSSGGVTVRRLPAEGLLPAAPVSAGVTLTAGPSVAAVTPGSLARGASTSITVQGVNLGGVTAIQFIDAAGAVDPNISFSGLTVNGDGTSLTASVTIAGTASLGTRIVVVSSLAGRSHAANVGGNAIQVVP